MSILCTFKALTRTYTSGFTLGPIDLEIPAGEVVGLLGQNGAGKTTMLRIMIGVLRSDSGSVRLWGLNHENETREIKERIGYVDEEPVIYDWMKPTDLERFLSPYYPRWSSQDFSKYLQRLEIRQDLSYGKLSKGNKVKLSIAAALAKRPELLILDEPTSGLDPVVRQDILHLLQQYRESQPNASIIFSSHILGDLEQICTRIVIIDRGKVLADAPLDEFHVAPPETVGQPTGLERIFLELIGKGGPHVAGHH